MPISHGCFRWSICSVLLIAACSSDRDGQHTEVTAVSNRPDIIATNAFYYYHDVEAAWKFYGDTLGLETVVDYGFAKILRLAESSYLTLVLASEGMHSADEPKIVTLHLVTDQLSRWHDHFMRIGRPIKYDSVNMGNQLENSFVVLDTEGYRLRFTRYNPHPNHNSFVGSFARSRPVPSAAGNAEDMSIRATAFSIYYNSVADVRPFFEGLFDIEVDGFMAGLPIYQMSGSGYVALEEYAGPKLSSPGRNGVTLSFLTSDVDAWFARASAWPGIELRTPEVLNEGGRVKVFVAYDPTGVFIEWDTFLEVAENQALVDYLQ